MNKIAFVVTIYPPHFHYFEKLKESFYRFNLDKQADLWLVFTTEEEKKLYGEYEKSIVIPENEHVSKGQGLVIIKKFRALKELAEQYKYIISIDAESVFVKELNLNNLCENYFQTGILYGNKIIEDGIDRAENIKRECKKFFESHPNYEKLNTPLYLWFNQLCIYDTDDLKQFFEIIDYAKFINKINFYTFDYYLYMYYLILYRNFKIEDIEVKAFYGFLGENERKNCIFYSQKYKNLKFNLCTSEIYHELDQSEILLLCHLDRNGARLKSKLNDAKTRFWNPIKDFFNWLLLPVKILRYTIKLNHYKGKYKE